MTYEQRASNLFTEFLSNGLVLAWARVAFIAALSEEMRKIAEVEREACAKIIDVKVEDWKHSMKTIKHFTGTYEEVELMEEISEAIRARSTTADSKSPD